MYQFSTVVFYYTLVVCGVGVVYMYTLVSGECGHLSGECVVHRHLTGECRIYVHLTGE